MLQGIKLAEDTNNAAVADFMRKVKAERLASWQQAGWLQRNVALPADILLKLQQRHEWAGKYDPFRLLVEHAALARTKLRGEIVGERASYVDFTNPDEWLVQPESPQRTTMIATAQEALRYLGVARAGLISKFDLCKFSFGYSRVGNTPRILKHGRMMPVRRNLFSKVQVGHESRHPVYVLEQSNEAFYFRLDEALVRAWLAQPEMGCADGALLDEYEYALPSLLPSGRETFHAKVVLADVSSFYVGSSNFMGSALDRSFECGVIVRGETARQLRYVLAALQSIARPVQEY